MKIRILNILFACLFCAPAFAQNKGAAAPDKGEEGYIVMDWDKFRQTARWEEVVSDKNHFVIPWNEVKDLLGIDIQQVNTAELKLPWKEFKTLLEWSIKEKQGKADEGEAAPIPYLLASADYTAADLNDDGVTFSSTFKVQVLKKDGWKTIPLLISNVAVSKVELPEGVFLQLKDNYYTLLTQTGEDFEAKIEFTVPVTKSGGTQRMNFAKVPSGSAVIDLTVAEQDVDVKIEGVLSKVSKEAGGKTRVVGALSAQSAVSVSWERAIPQAEKVPPKLYSENKTLVSIADGILIGRTQVSFNILHTATRQFELNVPKGVSVLEVTAASLRDWRVAGDKLSIQLEKEVIGTYVVDVKYEQPLGDQAGQVPLPVITASGVEREKGHIGVVALSNVEIKSDQVQGAQPHDVKDLPPEIVGMTSQPILLGFRYVLPKFEIVLGINKHPDVDVLLTVIDRAFLTVMMTRDGRRITKALFNVRNNRNQFLRLKIPEGAEIWSASVAGKTAQPASDENGRVLLPLVRSQGGLSSFPVELVYVEEGERPDEKGRGNTKVTLPGADEPITHLMVDLYLPKELRYRHLEGTLREVDTFTPVGSNPNVDVADQVQALQQQFVAQQAAQVKAAGASPIQVQLPVSGKKVKLEKILVIGGEQWFSFEYYGLD